MNNELRKIDMIHSFANQLDIRCHYKSYVAC